MLDGEVVKGADIVLPFKTMNQHASVAFFPIIQYNT